MPDTDRFRQPLIVVERWRRYGHDRAYVRVDDVKAGYRDLTSGELHCTHADLAQVVAEATEGLVRIDPALKPPTYSARHALDDVASAEPVPVERSAAAESEPPLRPDQDLALTRAGAAARTQAVALRAEAPVRTFVARVVGAKTDERAWRIGADAEEEVAWRLRRLGDRWHVLHSIPVGEKGSDIDHLVIGPGGVFTINTKHHPDANVWVRGDTFKVNGTNQPYVRNSRYESQRAARLLTARTLFDVEVRGLIVVVGAHEGFTVKDQPPDGMVKVVARRAVSKHLSRLPEVLEAPSIERIYEVARHLATWQPKTVQWQEF